VSGSVSGNVGERRSRAIVAVRVEVEVEMRAEVRTVVCRSSRT
jgi:hypothetical protein